MTPPRRTPGPGEGEPERPPKRAAPEPRKTSESGAPEPGKPESGTTGSGTPGTGTPASGAPGREATSGNGLRRGARALTWAARVSALTVLLYVSLFALDVFAPGVSLGEALVGFFIHLVPTLLLAGVVALAWRWPWIGALVFGAAAIGYAADVGLRRPVWVLAISGPAFLVATLFLLSWLAARRSGAGRGAGRAAGEGYGPPERPAS